VRLLFLLLIPCAAVFAQERLLKATDAVRVLELQGETNHVQGIDTDGVYLWLTSVDSASRKGYLREFRLGDGREVRRIELQDGERYHPGGIAADGESIWIPVAEYRAHSSAIIQKRNRRTFALEFQFSVPDHIGCVAVTPEFIIGGNWDSAEFYFWDHRGKLIRNVVSGTGNSYQDIKFKSGGIIASGGLPERRGAIDWLDFPSMHILRRVIVGTTNRGASLAREAMTIFQDQVWLLPEDNQSRLFVFPLGTLPSAAR
jgi:hypothetical protein